MPSLPTIVIVHPVSLTKDWLFGQDPGFPPGSVLLNPMLIHRAIQTLVAAGVAPFDDGLFHGDIHPFGFEDLLAGVSPADAVEDGFEQIPSPKKKIFIHFGIRWEVNPSFKRVRLYGPQSDSSHELLIDLTAGGAEEKL